MQTAPIEVSRPSPVQIVPEPAPIEVLPYKWQVLIHSRLPAGKEWVLYAVTPRDYETMARNAAEVLRWVEEARWRLDYYRRELEPPESAEER